MFNLQKHLRTCECGHVKGYYDANGKTAVTNGNGVAVAFGNGSFVAAIHADAETDWRNTPNWKKWYDSRPGDNIFLAWVRNHDGPSNPHSRVDPNL
jgi:hypothetical protein